MSSDHTDRRAREDRRNEPRLRAVPRPALTAIGRATSAFTAKLTALNDERLLCGQRVPALEDPRDVLGLIEAHARNARLLGGLVESFDVIGALAIAGRMGRENADEADPHTGAPDAA